ncbi:unnamed protein product, partial [Ectocarpus sp. 8 AP-2014]
RDGIFRRGRVQSPRTVLHVRDEEPGSPQGPLVPRMQDGPGQAGRGGTPGQRRRPSVRNLQPVGRFRRAGLGVRRRKRHGFLRLGALRRPPEDEGPLLSRSG